MSKCRAVMLRLLTLLCAVLCRVAAAAAELPAICISADGRGFVLAGSDQPFTPWGFNYDHDHQGRLLEDYWQEEWETVEQDFAEMRLLGANVVRIHLQFGKFMEAADRPRPDALRQLDRLLSLAQQEGLYLDLTGLGCYHKADVPAWYDQLSETARWEAQAVFWGAISLRCRGNSAVFCFDLMNEPVVPGGVRPAGEWLGPDFAGKHFVQFITLDQGDRPRPEIAAAWVKRLSAAVRQHDPQRLVTVGLVDWSLDRPGLTSGFVPSEIAEPLDFLAVHIYPESGRAEEALQTLRGFNVGKPIVIEETFPLKCSPEEFQQFLDRSAAHASGWIGFYWGRTPEEYAQSDTLQAALMQAYFKAFRPPAATGQE